MAAKVLKILGNLTKKRVVEPGFREDKMVAKDDAASTKDKKARTPEEKAARAKKREGRVERQAKRSEKRKEKSAQGGRSGRLCSLATVEVKKDSDGFHVAVNGRKSFTIASNETSQVLRDLETAIQVIRGQM